MCCVRIIYITIFPCRLATKIAWNQLWNFERIYEGLGGNTRNNTCGCAKTAERHRNPDLATEVRDCHLEAARRKQSLARPVGFQASRLSRPGSLRMTAAAQILLAMAVHWGPSPSLSRDCQGETRTAPPPIKRQRFILGPRRFGGLVMSIANFSSIKAPNSVSSQATWGRPEARFFRACSWTGTNEGRTWLGRACVVRPFRGGLGPRSVSFAGRGPRPKRVRTSGNAVGAWSVYLYLNERTHGTCS